MLQPSKTHLESETGPKPGGDQNKTCATICLERSAAFCGAGLDLADKSADLRARTSDSNDKTADFSKILAAGPDSSADSTLKTVECSAVCADMLVDCTDGTVHCLPGTADSLERTADSLERTADSLERTAGSLERTDEDMSSWLNQDSQTVPLLKANGSGITLPFSLEKLPQQQQQLTAYRSLGSLPTCDTSMNGNCQKALLLTEDSNSDIILV
jgi:hypothetical protein